MPDNPRRPLEAICRICGEIFGESNLTGPENFFDLGGSSLDVVELIAALEEEDGYELDYEDVFNAETLTQLAARCKSLSRGPDPSSAGSAPF